MDYSVNGTGSWTIHIGETRMPTIYPTQKSTLKCIKDVNVKSKSYKHLEENICSKFPDISPGNFLDLTPKAKVNKSKNKQMGLHQTKKLLHSKRNP